VKEAELDKKEAELDKKEAELDKKEAEYIRQVNLKEIDKDRFQELVGELDLERVMGESIAEGPATTQATMQDESKEEELAAATKVVESLTVRKGKRKVAPTRAKVYMVVEGLVNNLPRLLSTCANTISYSATDA
jgi:hypothetical protein